MSNAHPDDFEYNFYDYSNETRSERDENNAIPEIPSWSSLVRILLVILLRVGLVLVHVGSVPVNNVNLILLQNVIDFSWVTVVYFTVGNVIAYTGDIHGMLGEGYWVGDTIVDKDEAVIGWSAVVIAAGICTCGIVGRTHTVGYLVIGLLLAGLIQPFLIHWIWTPKGWIRTNTLAGTTVKFHDYAGSVVVHLVGGLSGLIGCMTLGRRILRLSAIDDASIAIGSSATVFAGHLLVYVGLQTLSLPSFRTDKLKRIEEEAGPNVFLNNLLAACSCSMCVVAFHFMLPREEFNHWTVMRCVQATISGLVIISAGTNFYSPQAAIGLCTSGSVIFYLVSRQVFRSALEDYCNVVAIHLVSAVLGSLLVPFFDTGTGNGSGNGNGNVQLILLNFAWQLICLLTVITSVSILTYIAFALLEYTGLLRNRSEYLNHLRASIAEGTSARRSTLLERLFGVDRNPVYLQPGAGYGEPTTGTHARRYQTEGDTA